LYRNLKTKKKNSMAKLVNFGEALEALKKGRRVYRQLWGGKDGTTTLEFIPETDDTFASIQVNLWNGRKVTGWVNTTEDLIAEDWIIL